MTYKYAELATTDYGNVLERSHFFDISIRPLWSGMPRISGPAYTVQLASGDNLMLHNAIYKAPEGSIIVVDAVDCTYAVAGGNVCALAQQRGIKGFIVDGVIRDLSEVTEMNFPVYAKGVFPVPGKKEQYFELEAPIVCGGVTVCTGDVIVADMEGIVAIPHAEAEKTYEMAKAKYDADLRMSLAQWGEKHQANVMRALEAAKKP